jgi:putative hydrolase of the HAD superfamily
MQSVLNAADPPFHNAYWRHRHSYDLGQLDGVHYWQAVRRDLQRDLSADDLAVLIEADIDLWAQPNQPMIEWAAALQAAGVLTAILSNMGDAMEDGLAARLPWMANFPKHIYSHRLGIAKPDERIYRHAISALGIGPGEILFIDDRIENVEAARALGLNAVHYSSHSDFQREFHTANFTGLPQPTTSR